MLWICSRAFSFTVARKPVSRVLSRLVIYLGPSLPMDSSGMYRAGGNQWILIQLSPFLAADRVYLLSTSPLTTTSSCLALFTFTDYSEVSFLWHFP